MLADTDLYNILNVTSFTDLLDSFGSGKALFNNVSIPPEFTGKEVANFYDSGTFNRALDYGVYTYTINCRSETETGSKAMAEEAISLLNRVFYNDIFTNVLKLPTLPQADETDVYNTPLTVQILDKET